MPRITSVEAQKRTLRLRSGQGPRRFNIYLDGQFGFGADEDLVVEKRLVVGKQLDNSELEVILFEAELGKLMERMYRLFGIRMRSEKEVRNYFRNLNFKRKIKDEEEISELVIDELVEVLKRKSMIDDEAFAKAWVEARRRSQQKGKRALMGELLQKGVDRHIIVAALEENENDSQLAQQAMEKKIKAWKNLSKLDFRKKATEFLLRRGFDYSVVKDVVEKFMRKS